MNNKNTYKLNSFLRYINKLTPGKTAHSDTFASVTCVKAADYSKGHVARLNRSGYGTRKFKIDGVNGRFTPAKLREKLAEMA